MGLIEKHMNKNPLEIVYVGDSPDMPSLDQVTSDIEKMPKLKAKQVKTALEQEFQRGVLFPVGYAKSNGVVYVIYDGFAVPLGFQFNDPGNPLSQKEVIGELQQITDSQLEKLLGQYVIGQPIVNIGSYFSPSQEVGKSQYSLNNLINVNDEIKSETSLTFSRYLDNLSMEDFNGNLADSRLFSLYDLWTEKIKTSKQMFTLELDGEDGSVDHFDVVDLCVTLISSYNPEVSEGYLRRITDLSSSLLKTKHTNLKEKFKQEISSLYRLKQTNRSFQNNTAISETLHSLYVEVNKN